MLNICKAREFFLRLAGSFTALLVTFKNWEFGRHQFGRVIIDRFKLGVAQPCVHDEPRLAHLERGAAGKELRTRLASMRCGD